MIAVVTGASSGIGQATARRLAREPGARLVLVARREERLRSLADELGGATVVAADLTADDAPARVAEAVHREHGGLDLLVNNAGASWRGTFGEAGTDNLRRHMAVNFEAVARLTQALLPTLRASAPSAIVNVSSVAGRIARARAGAYSASKFALCGWSEALHLEEREHGVHVGLVLPGFVATEGFPQRELTERALTRRLVTRPEVLAEAIIDAGLNRRAERYSPRYYALVPALRVMAPGLVRRLTGGSAVTPSIPGEDRWSGALGHEDQTPR